MNIPAEVLELAEGAEVRPIPNFSDYYVTNDGKIISTKQRSAKVLSPSRHKEGYKRFVLHKSQGVSYVNLHRIVAIVFLGEPQAKNWQVRHLDGNPTNNHVSNLAWGTPLENSNDSVRLGRLKLGNEHPNAKVTEDEVRDIRQKYDNGERQVDLAKAYGITQSMISKIVRREVWLHV